MKIWKWEIILAVALAVCVSCKREERDLHVAAPEVDMSQLPPTDELHAGGPVTNAPPPPEYQETAYAINEGQQLYSAFNCVGCHAHGGGGMGVPLMDDKWIYGSRPEQIFATILQGRPKGMPSFRGKLNDHQVWELVAYVRSLSGQTPRTASPGRDDHMQSAPPPNSVKQAQPKPV